VSAGTVGNFEITGFEYWQWVKGDHVYDNGASVAGGDVPPELEAFRARAHGADAAHGVNTTKSRPSGVVCCVLETATPSPGATTRLIA
jgi:hypothetical protein